MIFERKIYKKLLEWKNESHGQTALLIKGARRLGKSTVAQEFGKNEYESFVAIDFAIFRLFVFCRHLFLVYSVTSLAMLLQKARTIGST